MATWAGRLADTQRLADKRKTTRQGAVEQKSKELRLFERVGLAAHLNANRSPERNQVEPHGTHRLQ